MPSHSQTQTRTDWVRSLSAWIPPASWGTEGRTADIRHHMLELLRTLPADERRAALAHRIRQAADAWSLWDLRDELQARLVEVKDGIVARQQVTELRFMFSGLLRGDRQRASFAD